MGIWVIRNKEHKTLYWSNHWGWIEDGEFMDIFSDEEVKEVRLPIDGEFVEL